MVCHEVKKRLRKDRTVIYMSGRGGEARKFLVSGRTRSDDFIPGNKYIVYYKPDSTSTVIAYEAIYDTEKNETEKEIPTTK